MARSAQELFQLYKAQKYEPFLKGVRGTYLFDIDQVGCWFASIEDAAVRSDEKRAEAECVIHCGEKTSSTLSKGEEIYLPPRYRVVSWFEAMSRSLRNLTDSRAPL